MKTRFRYIHFVREDGLWTCRNNRTDGDLGYVTWDREWKQYVFWPEGGIAFSHDCLTNISTFLKERNVDGREHRGILAEEVTGE